MSEENKDGPERDEEDRDDFRIRPFDDLRRLRGSYPRGGPGLAAVDGADNPRSGAAEDDFGLRRSTPEEALEFYREIMKEREGGEEDELAEFLDDE